MIFTGKYKYRLKQIDFDGTSTFSNILEVSLGVPERFILYQNYPNPFNSSTTISFSIPAASRVKLTLFDALGREVTQITNKDFSAGNHSINFNAANLTSGVYFYRIDAGSFVQSKKMILLK